MSILDLSYEELSVANIELNIAKMEASSRLSCCCHNLDDSSLYEYYKKRYKVLQKITIAIEERMVELRSDVSDMVN